MLDKFEDNELLPVFWKPSDNLQEVIFFLQLEQGDLWVLRVRNGGIPLIQ